MRTKAVHTSQMLEPPLTVRTQEVAAIQYKTAYAAARATHC